MYMYMYMYENAEFSRKRGATKGYEARQPTDVKVDGPGEATPC